MVEQIPRRTATVIWAALLAGPTTFLGVALYVVVGLRGGLGVGVGLDAAPLVWASLAMSAATIAASWRWAVRMKVSGSSVAVRGGTIPPGPEADALTRLIVACALCEGGALLAIVVFLLTGSGMALLPFALSWVALAAHFPGDQHWARLTGRPAGAATRPNPMIRG